ncbi:hypothetical protein CP532_0238 [Ophiocordyceps camponoti-leonardi (nom. inval.)]|nr:hypothetical protein CP532_0238 [Ophiocordyceps camponoti-leonardi (nom. inval.)]
MPVGVAWIPARREGETAVTEDRERRQSRRHLCPRVDVVSASRVLSPTRAFSLGSKQGTLSRWRQKAASHMTWERLGVCDCITSCRLQGNSRPTSANHFSADLPIHTNSTT